jgi:hypothetical protein
MTARTRVLDAATTIAGVATDVTASVLGWLLERRTGGQQVPGDGHQTPVPGSATPPARLAAPSALRPPPAPGPHDGGHGGTVTTVEIMRCGRTILTDHDKGKAEILHGDTDCPDCNDCCYLCGYYLRFDPPAGRWVPWYERCPAHENRERQP